MSSDCDLWTCGPTRSQVEASRMITGHRVVEKALVWVSGDLSSGFSTAGGPQTDLDMSHLFCK